MGSRVPGVGGWGQWSRGAGGGAKGSGDRGLGLVMARMCLVLTRSMVCSPAHLLVLCSFYEAAHGETCTKATAGPTST